MLNTIAQEAVDSWGLRTVVTGVVGAVVGGIVVTIFQHWLKGRSTRTAKISGTLRQSELVVPPDTKIAIEDYDSVSRIGAAKLRGLANHLAAKANQDQLHQPLYSGISELKDAAAEYEERICTLQKKWGQLRFSSSWPKFVWTGSITNVGKARANCVMLALPRLVGAQIERGDSTVPAEMLNGAIQVGNLQPGESVSLVAWSNERWPNLFGGDVVVRSDEGVWKLKRECMAPADTAGLAAFIEFIWGWPLVWGLIFMVFWMAPKIIDMF